ncbi:uncharacterized protein SCHCODRAFT_02520832 [Schizophyllum commune H4-8]|nr:uncharacterized protein SCHCODRAFT_02520832 [Schizophyllum commune H4-8]KAI5885338.1 hypothetical protein SCHCODRAFT_02520832 [Schizophyllum commune H4-8]
MVQLRILLSVERPSQGAGRLNRRLQVINLPSQWPSRNVLTCTLRLFIPNLIPAPLNSARALGRKSPKISKMDVSSESVTLPQELREETLKHLHTSPTALASCALAHRTLTPTAQALLFQKIILTDAHRARSLNILLHTSSHLARHVRCLIISEFYSADGWITSANVELATILNALSNITTLALRSKRIAYGDMGYFQHVLRRRARVLYALELMGVSDMPPELVTGHRLASLRLINVVPARTHTSVASESVSRYWPAGAPCEPTPPPRCAPSTLELVLFEPYTLEKTIGSIDTSNLARLRFDRSICAADPYGLALIARCAHTLEVLEIAMRGGGPIPLPVLPRLRTLALDVPLAEYPLLHWLHSAPNLRRLILCTRQDEPAITRTSHGPTLELGEDKVHEEELKACPQLKRIDCVFEADEPQGPLMAEREELIGTLGPTVKVMKVWAPDLDFVKGFLYPGMAWPDILDREWD